MTIEDEDTTSIPTLEQRRELITLVAMDGLKGLRANMDEPEIVEAVLQALCVEVLYLAINVDQEIEPSMKVVGALVGGLFGAQQVLPALLSVKETDDDDEGDRAFREMTVRLHEQGARLRAHIGRVIGLPSAGGTLAEDERVARETREARRAERDADMASMQAITAKTDEHLAAIRASRGE